MDIAVNAGNAMYYLPLLPLMAQRAKLTPEMQRDVYEVYVQEMINLSMGQAMDIAWHRGIANADELGEEDYLQMCAYKTGTLARMAAKMAAVIAGADKTLVEKLGTVCRKHRRCISNARRHFRFNWRRVCQEERRRRARYHRRQKKLNGYLHPQKSQQLPTKNGLLKFSTCTPPTKKLRDEAIALMQKYGALEHVKRTAERMVAESWSEAEKLLPTPQAKEKLKAVR